MKKPENEATKNSGSTHSGTPNPENPNHARSTEHKSGYGGETGQPRTRSDEETTKE